MMPIMRSSKCVPISEELMNGEFQDVVLDPVVSSSGPPTIGLLKWIFVLQTPVPKAVMIVAGREGTDLELYFCLVLCYDWSGTLKKG
jgi:hypothetical protein